MCFFPNDFFSSRYVCILSLIIVFHQPITTSYKILGLFPHPANSHYAVVDPLMVELAKLGHRVTVYSNFPKKISPSPNYVDVDMSGCFRLPTGVSSVDDKTTHDSLYRSLKILFDVHPSYEDVINCEPLMRLLKSHDENFDLAITYSFNNDLSLLFVHKLGIPYIGVIANIMFPWLTGRTANPDNPSYSPQMLSGYVQGRMTFVERIRNTYAYLLASVMYEYYSAAKTDRIRRKLFDYTTSIDEIVRNTSLVFTFTHISLNPVIPLVPAVIEIGGISIAPVASLPKDIETFINESEHGVVYFCMGSLLRGSSFPEEKRNAFLYAFSKIPQRVLWKWEGDELPGKSDKIMTSKWMPQRDILAHPKVKLFISHGGLLGTNEAVYEGVPILGIPIFGDQRTNVRSIEASGAGEMLDYNEISNEVVLEKIQRLINYPKYRENAEQLSRRYRDRPMPPLDTAVYWTEYVIRHKGAPHLRSPAVDMPWYQYLLLDVIAFVIFVLVATLVVIYYVLKFTLRILLRILFRIFTRKPNVSKTSKKVD